MTMPHLMNCDHSDDGWCLDCVKELHDKPTIFQLANWWKCASVSEREEFLYEIGAYSVCETTYYVHHKRED